MRLFEEQGGVCPYCGYPMSFGSVRKDGQPGKGYPTIEHKVPRSKGGGNEDDNIIVVHRKCNARKNIEEQRKKC